ncbi:hypothetical protein BA894_15790 [Vibrio natriegens]|nr:hypothetical protein BA894_15790 [Vibrio natriegens]
MNRPQVFKGFIGQIKEQHFTCFMPQRKSFSRFIHFKLQVIYIYKIYIYDLLLDLLLGSTVSVDNRKMINKIMDLLWIISCDLAWI